MSTTKIINGTLSATTISGGSVYVTSVGSGTSVTNLGIDNTGRVVSGMTTNPFTGGTVTGTTIFTNGVTVNTISATTYQNLPLDVNITGGTYSDGTATFTNNNGGTFNVTGFYTGDTTTITGATNVGTGLTIFDSIIDRTININSITGDSLEKITTTLSNNTIEVGVNEPKLSLWPLVVNGNRLLDGGVSYISGLTFDVSLLNYVIDGSIYKTSSSSQVILDSGDTSFDRIDVIYADISGNTGVLTGTASTNPEKPIVDSNTQVEVTFVSVPTTASTPTINTELIYDEKVGLPTEWNFLRFGNQIFRISGDSTAQSYSGSKSISVSGLTTSGGNYSNGFILSSNTVTDTTQFATLQFAIRNMSGNSTNTYILIQFLGQTGNVLNGSNVWLYGGAPSGQYYSYLPTNTSLWQLISIPLWRFYLTNTNVYGIKFSYLVGSTVARHYIDKIELVEGLSTSPPTNNWLSIKGDSTPTISAPAPNSTLTISGGTNISSSVSGTTTVVLNLDNNINLNGITATTISATTYQNLPTDIRVTGGTYSNGIATFTNNTGGTFNVTGFITGDTYVTGLTFNNTNYNLTIGRNDGVSFTDSLSILASDLTVTGGTYNSSNGTATFTNNTGGTFNVTGFITGFTDIYVTGATYSNNTFTFTNTSGNTFQTTFNSVTGLTINGNLNVTGTTTLNTLTATTISADTITATDYENLGLPDNETIEVVNELVRIKDTVSAPTGGTRTFLGNVVVGTGFTATTISATTYQNLPDNVSGNYLPLSGGTITGSTIFQSGLTANTVTISQTPNVDSSPTYILSRNNSTGNIEFTAYSAITRNIDSFVNIGSASTINWNVSGDSANYEVTLTANTTLNITNVRNGDYGTILISQDSVGSRTITLGTINGVSGTNRHKVSSGGAGTIYLTSTPNALDAVSFVYNGTNLYWTVGNDYT